MNTNPNRHPATSRNTGVSDHMIMEHDGPTIDDMIEGFDFVGGGYRARRHQIDPDEFNLFPEPSGFGELVFQ